MKDLGEVLLPLSLRAPALIIFGVQAWRLLLRWFPELIEPLESVSQLREDARKVTWWLLGWYVMGMVLSSQLNLGWAALWLWTLLLVWLLLPWGIHSVNLFKECLARCLFTFQARSTAFGDVMLGDVLCSYAKVLADWDALLWCHLLVAGAPASSCVPSLLSVLLVCLPYGCRLRQCFQDWLATGQARHLVNAFKYGCSFPAFYLSHLLSLQQTSMPWWLFWLSLNWTISVCWDTLMDWALLRDLDGLRPKRFHPNRWLYYAAIPLNATLRALWILRMASLVLGWRISWWDDTSILLPLLEISRRFLWLIFRLDAELYYYRQPTFKTLT